MLLLDTGRDAASGCCKSRLLPTEENIVNTQMVLLDNKPKRVVRSKQVNCVQV